MDDELRQGDRVYTPRYGRGDVLVAEWIGDYQKLTIRFESGEQITLRDAAAFHLEKIEEAPRVPVPPAVDEVTQADADAGVGHEDEVEMDRDELKRLLVEALEEVCGPVRAQMSDRWEGGTLVLNPGKPDTQSKEVPLDNFFQKIVRVRDQLRVLEQKINSHKALTDADKLTMQQYITRCYGTLTTFNVLFKDDDDRFSGSSGGV